MTKLDATQHETLRLARKKTVANSWKLLQTAVELFEKEQYPVACFLAITSIEDAGKLFLMHLTQGEDLVCLGFPEPSPDFKALDKLFRKHNEKAVQAAFDCLYINSGADRRHGIHPLSGLYRTSGIIFLGRSKYWMTIRNSCLYTDVNLASNLSSSPLESISREHAYYFICMGYEVLAENAGFIGLGSLSELLGNERSSPDKIKSHKESVKFCQDRISDLEAFMEKWSKTVDIDQLDFLKDPKKYQDKAESLEANESKTRKKKDTITSS
jgi:AbiV family abortive infection protein